MRGRWSGRGSRDESGQQDGWSISLYGVRHRSENPENRTFPSLGPVGPVYDGSRGRDKEGRSRGVVSKDRRRQGGHEVGVSGRRRRGLSTVSRTEPNRGRRSPRGRRGGPFHGR